VSQHFLHLQRQGKRPKVQAKQKGFKTFFNSLNFHLSGSSESVSKQPTQLTIKLNFWPKPLVIFYPSLENSTTHITIVPILIGGDFNIDLKSYSGLDKHADFLYELYLEGCQQ
jgi:hypothetical protein